MVKGQPQCNTEIHPKGIIINSCFSLEDQCAALAENVHVRCEALWGVHLSVALFLFPKTTVLKKFRDHYFC